MKNRLEVKQEGNVITIKVIATSEELANKIFDVVEAFAVAAVRTDLKREWDRNND